MTPPLQRSVTDNRENEKKCSLLTVWEFVSIKLCVVINCRASFKISDKTKWSGEITSTNVAIYYAVTVYNSIEDSKYCRMDVHFKQVCFLTCSLT